jgi:hypothetical protein
MSRRLSATVFANDPNRLEPLRMSSPTPKDGSDDHKRRVVEISNPLVREASTKISGDATDFDVHLVLFDLCLRMYYAGLVDGANEASTHAAEHGAGSDFRLGVTVPSGPLGTAS